MDPLRINLWSGPRNLSTALMYSFAQRADTRVVDEPLYAHYLKRSGVLHPGRERVLASQDADGQRVVERVLLGPADRAVLFFKQMAHHLEGLDRRFLGEMRNVLLIRDPGQMLTSLIRNIPEPTLRDTGLAVQSRLLEQLRALGDPVPIVDARLLLEDPRGVLGALCAALGLPFDEAMLSWTPGARPEDGVWAEHWYGSVHRSSGFAPYREKREAVPARLEPLLEECRAHYEPMLAQALGF